MNTKRSESMKKAHAEGRHPGWSFINSDPTRMSYPEKYIKKCLHQNNENIHIESERIYHTKGV